MPRITFLEDNRSHDATTDDWLYDVCVDAKASIRSRARPARAAPARPRCSRAAILSASPRTSMLLHLLDARSTRRVQLFFGVRAVQDLFYTDLLRGLENFY